MSLLSVENLSIDFSTQGRWLPAVSDVSFSLEKGEVLALVGESGCGKSVSCLSLAKLLPEPPARYAGGRILLEDSGKANDVLSLPPAALRKIRGGRIAYIFQEPSVSLNPVFRIGEQIAEALELHRPEVSDIRAEVVALLRQVGISEPERRVDAYPHEMSGGMQQRVMIAMALACKPEILVADEPTTALDVTIQAQILDLLRKLRAETGMAIILVTHNLGLVADLADRVIVMYAGRMVESAPVAELLANPLHPYTQALLAAVPKLGHDTKTLSTIPGQVPSPAKYPKGCRFFGRCALSDTLSDAERKVCAEDLQDWREILPGHGCRCWRVKGEKS